MPKSSPDPAASDTSQTWVVRCSMDHDAMLEAFAKRARRGKLAEFRAGALGQHGGDFSVEAAGNPFDHRLIGTFDGDAQNTTITLRLIRLKMMPAIFAAVIIVSVWPGVWLTDSMLVTYFAWYSNWTQSMPWLTYAWYLPMSVLPLPWVWRGIVRKSRTEAVESAREMIEAITQTVDGTLEDTSS